MAEGRFSTLLEKIKKAYLGTGTGMDKLKAGWKWENGQYVKAWSGASEVAVILDGTEIQTLEVDDEDDIIDYLDTPVIPSDATFLGWTTDNTSESPMESIIADGEPKTVYGIYQYSDRVLVTNANVGWGNGGYQSQNEKKSFCSVNGNKYKSVRIVASQFDTEVGSWNIANIVYLSVGVNGGSSAQIYMQRQYNDQIYSEGGSIDSVFSVPQEQTYAYGQINGDCYEANIRATITGIGRTIVG